jgi:predicted ferric reductase
VRRVTHTWWYLSRSGGIVAWLLLATSVVWGLLLSTRVLDRRPSPRWLTDLHRFLGGLALVFTAVHVGALVADSYVHFGVKELAVPLASSWHPVAVAWGVIGAWLLIAVEVTSLLMRQLPRRAWHAVHMSSFGIFVVATAHAFTAGTDARNLMFVMGGSALSATVVLLSVVRFTVPRQRGARRAAAGTGGQAAPAAPAAATAVTTSVRSGPRPPRTARVAQPRG